jgi:ABC-2 type transport system permease protein
LFAALFGMGVLVCEAMFPGTLDIGAFLKLNFTTMLVNMTVMMISFFFSCLYNDSKMSLGFGAGIPILFLLFNMLGGASEEAEKLKSLSIYGFYDPVELTRGAEIWPINLIYIGMVIILFIAGVLIFRKKKLPL